MMMMIMVMSILCRKYQSAAAGKLYYKQTTVVMVIMMVMSLCRKYQSAAAACGKAVLQPDNRGDDDNDDDGDVVV